MARKAVVDRRKRIVDHIARMLVHYLETKVFKVEHQDDLVGRLQVSKSVLGVPWWSDIPEIAESASLDIGLVVRDQKGNEVTFWPSENLSDRFKPRRAAGKKVVVEKVDPAHRTRITGFAAGGTRHSRR